MPLAKYFKGKGEEVMKAMRKKYGSDKGKQVFHATAKKQGLEPSEEFKKKRGLK